MYTSPISWFELLFLSFSTLTSVGLSDVIPVGSHARSFAMVEMVAGVFYVALVVARLVSLAVVASERMNLGHMLWAARNCSAAVERGLKP